MGPGHRVGHLVPKFIGVGVTQIVVRRAKIEPAGKGDVGRVTRGVGVVGPRGIGAGARRGVLKLIDFVRGSRRSGFPLRVAVILPITWPDLEP